MIKPGLINLDFVDIKAVMSEMGKAMMGTGEASGEQRATEAAESAINNPLLDDTSMRGARAVLINVTGGMDMTLFEVDEAANRIRGEVDPDATIIFGSAFDERLEGIMRVSVVATGIDAQAFASPIPQPTEKVTVKVSPVMPAPAVSIAPDTSASDMSIIATQEPAIAHSGAETTTNEVTAIAEASNPGDDADAPDMFEKPSDKPDGEDVKIPASTSKEDAETVLKQPERSTHKEAVVIRRPSYIPAPPADTGSDNEVVKTAPISEPRPSLMNRISGLWSVKQDSTPKPHGLKTDQLLEPSIGAFGPAVAKARAETTSEPLTPAPTVAASNVDITQPVHMGSAEPAAEAQQSTILDLPHVDVVQTTLPVEPQSGTPDDDLDIPAFLRRQAN